MDPFVPNRALLNPKFESYRAGRVNQDDVVSHYSLEHVPTQATASRKSPLAFQEVQSRITHNHLTVAKGYNRAMYVDSQNKVILVELDEETAEPNFRVIYQLPTPVNTVDADYVHPEYPSSAFLDESTAFVADGHGNLHILEINSGVSANGLIFELSPPDSSHISAVPFRIHQVTKVSPTFVIAVLSSRHYDPQRDDKMETTPPTIRKKHGPVEYDIWAVKFSLPLSESSDTIHKLDVLWRRRGEEAPIHTSYDESRSAFLLVGGSAYRDPQVTPATPYEPSLDELAPIPRRGEDLDNASNDVEKPPPYSWTQTSDSVTVAFPLPSTTPKSNIKVHLTPRSLTVHIQGSSDTSAVPLPHYSAKTLWDGISSSSSFWTWDKEAEHSFGLLTLHLDKQHEGTKWVQVFKSAGALATSEADPTDVEVPETLDPSELWKIRESLEKYTTALRDGGDPSGLGLGGGMPSLAEGELDDEVDSAVGRNAFVTWVGADGSVPTWSSKFSMVPVTLLSTPLPGGDVQGESLVIKNSLDGTVFTTKTAASPEDPPAWTHTSTFSVLAFVLASKQDTRFTHHVSNATLAFDNGARSRGGNVYIYYSSNDNYAKLCTLKVADGSAGSLLGVGALRAKDGKLVILCLSEGDLAVIHDVL